MFKFDGKYGNIHIDGRSIDRVNNKRSQKMNEKKSNKGNC